MTLIQEVILFPSREMCGASLFHFFDAGISPYAFNLLGAKTALIPEPIRNYSELFAEELAVSFEYVAGKEINYVSE